MRRNWGIAAVVIVATLTGCGDGKVPAAQWASKVCAAVGPWRAQIEQLNAQAQR